MTPARTCAAALLGSLLLLSAAPARAYCRTTTSSTATHDGHVCTPPLSDDSGAPISWHMPRITYSLQQDAAATVPFEQAEAALRAAFDTWMSADCCEGHPRIELVETDPAVCAAHEYNKERGNANIISFVDQGWIDDTSKVAVTTVTFDTETGEIYDADMALNSTDHAFSTTGAPGAFDLQSVLTHETGHFLGLAHSNLGEATMFESATAGTELRSLTSDDIAGICAIYPPAPIAEDCDATPRHGFSLLCAADQPAPPGDEQKPAADRCCCTEGYECVDGQCIEGGCGCTTSPSRPGPWPALLPLGAAALARRRRSGIARTASRR